MRLRLGPLAAVALLLLAACTSPPAPPPTVAPTQAPAASESRVSVLNAANAAFATDPSHAAQLYERVSNTPPGADESPQLASAVTDFAYFRGAIAHLAAGDEDAAKAQLDALRARDANAPLARLGAQVWDQYGMTASLRGACAQVQPQVASQAAPTLATLTAAGVQIDPATLCSVA